MDKLLTFVFIQVVRWKKLSLVQHAATVYLQQCHSSLLLWKGKTYICAVVVYSTLETYSLLTFGGPGSDATWPGSEATCPGSEATWPGS